jgi:Pyridine nucleotide-disulphide oxidoreductase
MKMLDQPDGAPARDIGAQTVNYDLAVVGAGIAGLNALYAAIQYLPKTARVLLIDQKAGAGGMWNTAYDYVRLHQPHPMFTVGDLKWAWNMPRAYLAKRDEVRDHLASSVQAVSRSVDLSTLFGHTVASCEEVGTSQGARARLTVHPNGRPEQVFTVEAARAIYAPGLNYRVAEPLALSSGNVVSIIPQDLLATLAAHPNAPVCVVGGGKTGMDTVLAVLGADPGRKVSLINGRGTNFLNRTKYIPTGVKRWTSGSLVSRLFRDLALSFDGDNEDHTIQHFRTQHSTEPNSTNGVFLYGLQSEEEHARVAQGLAKTHSDYLDDVTDTASGVTMTFRSGATETVKAGTIFVNCTGSFFRGEDLDEPQAVLSPNGAVLRIVARDGFHFLTSVAGFFATHLLYRDALRGKDFYTLDHEGLFRENRNAWIGASAAQAYMNQVIAVQTLPMMLLDRCGLDLDRWYPLPRRLRGLLQMKSSAERDIAHCRKVLDRVAERFDVHCGPL